VSGANERVAAMLRRLEIVSKMPMSPDTGRLETLRVAYRYNLHASIGKVNLDVVAASMSYRHCMPLMRMRNVSVGRAVVSNSQLFPCVYILSPAMTHPVTLKGMRIRARVLATLFYGKLLHLGGVGQVED
jgi:hypothetical protein